MQQNLTYPGGPRARSLVAGLAVSLLLHIVLLAFLRAPTAPPLQPDEPRWTQPLSVRLLPPPVVPRTEPPPPPRQAPKRRAERRPAPPAAPTQAQEREPEREPDRRPTMTVVPSAPAEPTQPAAEPAPRFDRDAAKATARAIAGDLDTPSSNWAAEKLNQGKGLKETKEDRLGRNIANSARPDCKTAYAGLGLFAPLKMLMDKKDSGCKF